MQTADVFLPPRVSAASQLGTWTLVKWLVREGDSVYRSQRIALLRCARTGAIEYIEAPHAGRLTRVSVKNGLPLSENHSIVASVEFCPHSVVFRGLCALCGSDVDAAHFAEDTKLINSGISVGYDQKFLTVSRTVAETTSASTTNMLLKAGRLALVLDLDHTLVHATADPVVPTILNHSPRDANLNSVFSLSLKERLLKSFASPMFIKLRPGLREFLSRVASKFQLHIYTMGSRPYADHVARLIDPDKRLFYGRVTSREDFEEGAWNRKNLERIFPCDDSLAVIVDDREDVWISENGPSFMPNLVRAQPYFFWNGLQEVYDSTSAVNVPLTRYQTGIHKPPHPEKVHSPLQLDGPATRLSLRNYFEPNATAQQPINQSNKGGRRCGPQRKRLKNESPTDSSLNVPQTCDSHEGQDFSRKQLNNPVANGVGNGSLRERNADSESHGVKQVMDHSANTQVKAPHESNCSVSGKILNENLKNHSDGDSASCKKTEQAKGGNNPIIGTEFQNGLPNHRCEQKPSNQKAGNVYDSVLGKRGRVQRIGSPELKASPKDNVNGSPDLSPLMKDPCEAQTKSSICDDNSNKTVVNGSEADISVDENLEVQKVAKEMWDKDSSQETRDYLIRLAEILEECHRRFFEPTVLSRKGNVETDKEACGARRLATADVKIILSDMRAEVLRGCTVTFTGVVPLGVDPELVPLWNLAKRLGAECLTEFKKGKTTHMVVAENLKASTQKCEEAFQSGCTFVVTSRWLEDSAINFQRRAEFQYHIAGKEWKFHTQAEYKSKIEANFAQVRRLLDAQIAKTRPSVEGERFAKSHCNNDACKSDLKEQAGTNEQKPHSGDEADGSQSNSELLDDELEAAMDAVFEDEDEDEEEDGGQDEDKNKDQDENRDKDEDGNKDKDEY